MSFKWKTMCYLIVIIYNNYALSQVNESDLDEYNNLLKPFADAPNDLWLDLSMLLNNTKAAGIIDTTMSESDHRTNLLRTLFYKNHVSVMVVSNVKHIKKKIIREELLQKNMFFILFESLEVFEEFLHGNDTMIFKESPSSHYIITVTNAVETADCSSTKYDDLLKEKTGDLFLYMWKTYKILETLIFLPNICERGKILRYDPILLNAERFSPLGVSILTDADIATNKRAFLHSYYNFHGYPLEVRLFERIPTLVKNLSQSFMSTFLYKDLIGFGNAGGIDGFMLGNMAKYLNLSLRISAASDGQEYGWRMPNGTFTGTIADVIARRADISFNGRFLKDYGSPDIDFTFPIFNDAFCVLVPKSLQIPTWMNIFQGLSYTVWKVTLVTVVVCGIVWWLLKTVAPKDKKTNVYKKDCCWYCMDSFLMIASQPIVLPTLDRERIFIASCLIFNIILSGTFQGYLNTAFSTTRYYPDINSLQELDDSGLFIATSSQMHDIFGSGISSLMTHLGNKIKLIKMPAIDEAAQKRDVAAAERRSDAILLIQLKYLGKDGEPLLHIVNECPRNYYLTYVVHRNCPFLPHINRFLQRAWEGGFNKFWYDMTMYSIILQYNSGKLQKSDLKKLSIVDVQTAFLALGSGLLMGLAVFLCEQAGRLLARRGWRRGRRAPPTAAFTALADAGVAPCR